MATLFFSLATQDFQASVAMVHSVDPCTAGSADNRSATHTDADAWTIVVKMASSHEDLRGGEYGNYPGQPPIRCGVRPSAAWVRKLGRHKCGHCRGDKDG